MIIGLSGYAGSGKDEVAKILLKEYGFKRIAFADKVREILYELDPVVMVDVHYKDITVKDLVNDEGWDDAKKNKEVRSLLQRLGVAVRNNLGLDAWVEAALNNISLDENVVVTDVRFINEASKIKEMGGVVWRVKRPDVEAINNHISETELDGYKVDQIFYNNGSLEDLNELVKNRMKGNV
jgi:cytidylate kinase